MKSEKTTDLGILEVSYYLSAAIFLFAAAAAKLYSLFGAAGILEIADPVLALKTRWILFSGGALELIVGTYIILGKDNIIKHFGLLWLCFAFISYRLLLWNAAPSKRCPCLGTITERLRINEASADILLKVMLVYWTLGSMLFLIQRRNQVITLLGWRSH